jgi:arylsulfatase A-like enzyme
LTAQIALYDGDIRVVDDALRHLRDTLEEAGEIWDTLFVVTSDHGEEFLEHGSGGHGQLYGETLRVPLLMSHPGLRLGGEAVVSEPVGAVDVMPTLLDLLGVEAPAGLHGRSRVDQMVGVPDTSATAYSSSEMTQRDRVSVLDSAGHWVDGRHQTHFFRLPDDPEEQWDMLGTLAADERERYENRANTLRATATVGSATPVVLDAHEREALRALGYID